MDPTRRGYRGLVVVASLAIALLITAPAALATDAAAAGPDADLTEPAVVGSDQALEPVSVAQLRAEMDDLSARYQALEADNDSLQRTIADVTAERDQLAASLDRFDELYGPLEADRQLLLELRKGLPETRPEVEAQLERIRTLALTADPAGLGQLVDRVGDTAGAFLEWRFTDYGTADEASRAYIDSGANAFDSTMSDLRNEVLRSVANRLDAILTVIDRVR